MPDAAFCFLLLSVACMINVCRKNAIVLEAGS